MAELSSTPSLSLSLSSTFQPVYFEVSAFFMIDFFYIITEFHIQLFAVASLLPAAVAGPICGLASSSSSSCCSNCCNYCVGIGALQLLSSGSVQLSSAQPSLTMPGKSTVLCSKVLCGNPPLPQLSPLPPSTPPLLCASRARGTCQKARTFEQKQIPALGRVCDSVCASECVYYNA